MKYVQSQEHSSTFMNNGEGKNIPLQAAEWEVLLVPMFLRKVPDWSQHQSQA